MASKDDHFRTTLLLAGLSEPLINLLLQNVHDLELQEQQNLRALQALMEQRYPRQSFPAFWHEIGHIFKYMDLRGVSKVLGQETEPKAKSASEVISKGENWTKLLDWFIPRKYHHVIGDIIEDCAEMRRIGCTEMRIKFHVMYQWLIAVATLVPSSIVGTLRQVISPPK